MAGDLLADKREEALRVRVALDEAAASPEARLELRKVSDHAVVGEQTTFLLEWMRVRRNQTTGRGETDVGDEGLRLHISRLAGEGPILECSNRTLVDSRQRVGREVAETCAIGLAVTLRDQAVLGVEQPERGTHAIRSTGHTE